MGFWVYFKDDKTEYYDSDACELYFSSDRSVMIVGGSKAIFDFLIEHRYHVMSREQISFCIDSTSYYDRSSRRVDVAVNTLRKKLEEYRCCVDSVRGKGYRYVGPPKVDKEKETDCGPQFPNRPEPDTKEPALQGHNLLHPETRAKRVVANIESSLEKLIQADSVPQIGHARFRIKHAIRGYADEVSFSFSPNGDEDSESWLRRHERWLRKTINYCRSKLETLDQDADLIDLKMQLLDYIYDWHIYMELLGAQLALEMEALALSGHTIGKEIIQSRIDRIEKSYRFASVDAAIAEAELGEKIDGYQRGGMEPSI